MKGRRKRKAGVEALCGSAVAADRLMNACGHSDRRVRACRDKTPGCPGVTIVVVVTTLLLMSFVVMVIGATVTLDVPHTVNPRITNAQNAGEGA